MQLKVVGLPWFRSAKDFDALRPLLDDRDTFFPTFDEWAAKMAQTEDQLTGKGFTVVRAYLDPVEFPVWCAAEGLDIDSKARIRWGHKAAGDWWAKTRGN